MRKQGGTTVPEAGTIMHRSHIHPVERVTYAASVSCALRRDFGGSRHATKIVMKWTGAKERTVKHWFAGTRGPSGEHLASLVGNSDEMLADFLLLCGRKSSCDDVIVIDVQ